MPGRENGAALVIALMFLAILAVLGTTAVLTTTTEIRIGSNYRAGAEALYDAEAGVRFAVATMEAALKTAPPGFSLPTSTDPDDANHTSALAYTPPQGFSFAISDIAMIAANRYSFTSTGNGPDNSKAAIEVTFSTTGPFNYAVFGNMGVAMSGNGYTDSYNSSMGPYTHATRSTNGNIGTNSTGPGAVALAGNVQVWGDAAVGTGGDSHTGIRTTGHSTVHGAEKALDEPKDMTVPTVPAGGTSRPQWILSGHDSDTLGSGTYRMPGINISGHGVGNISGDVTLYVTGNIIISGHGRLNILAGGSLTIYVAGNIFVSGNGITNGTSYPKNLQIYGASSCAMIAMSGNADLCGAVYAPAAFVAISGNSDIYGSIIAGAIAMSGNGNVHYDEALQTVGPGSDLKLLSWRQEM